MIDKLFLFFLRLISNNIYAMPDPGEGGNIWVPPAIGSGDEPPKLVEIGGVVDRIFGYIFPVGVLLAVVLIIVGGYMWIVSGGDPGRKQQAQGTLTWAVIGLVVLFLVKALLEVLVNFLVV